MKYLTIITIACVIIYSIILIDKFSKTFNEIDAKEIVIDEFLGMSLAVIPFYVYVAIDEKWNMIDDFSGVILACFVLFRFFDIIKPFPINLIDKKLKNGLGVVMDDLVAGLFSFLIVWITVFYIL